MRKWGPLRVWECVCVRVCACISRSYCNWLKNKAWCLNVRQCSQSQFLRFKTFDYILLNFQIPTCQYSTNWESDFLSFSGADHTKTRCHWCYKNASEKLVLDKTAWRERLESGCIHTWTLYVIGGKRGAWWTYFSFEALKTQHAAQEGAPARCTISRKQCFLLSY